jgi:hypothetical protein
MMLHAWRLWLPLDVAASATMTRAERMDDKRARKRVTKGIEIAAPIAGAGASLEGEKDVAQAAQGALGSFFEAPEPLSQYLCACKVDAV